MKNEFWGLQLECLQDSHQDSRHTGVHVTALIECREVEYTAVKKGCIFIDNSNLFHAIKDIKANRHLDYIRLKRLLANGHDVDIRLYYSMPAGDVGKLVKFYNGLRNFGYELIELPLRERLVAGKIEKKEKGLDCEIVHDMTKRSILCDYDFFVLVAGDEDYARTIRNIHADTNVEVYVAFFSHAGCSGVLKNDAAGFIDLSAKMDYLFKIK